ncbi:MAG: hypothetical protein CML73_01260 [Rhodobiaceae bacterium]|nr:hypothetical protein [Rhodobiaceae bacterium]|tara:strand:+ start:162 stop:539 length:378 start_codon:yes stop_codon:yes gene_type:complete
MELEYLIKKVNKHFNCDITQNSRERELVMARAVYFWLAKYTSKKSMKKIGAAVGRDHASVVYALSNLDNWIKWDDFFRVDFETLKMIVLSSYETEKITAESLLYKYNNLVIENDVLKKQLKKYQK